MTAQHKLVVIPLDDRIVNYESLQLLGEAGGFQITMPPKEWLGTPWRTGQTDKIANWLLEGSAEAQGILVAVDTLGYGGLVNSRRSPDSAESVLARLQILRDLKRQYPDLLIFAYNILMRVNRSNDAEEEKPYIAEYGRSLFEMSVCEDRLEMAVGTEEDKARLAELRIQVPKEIVADYLAGRARNHQVNCAMIDWTAEGVFNHLIIAQDDTIDYGWNIAEARRLRQYVSEKQVMEKISIYPGTDDIGMLLVGCFAAGQYDFHPLVWTRYSSVRHGQVITHYEDRPMEELIKAHLGPLGGMLVETPDKADVCLYVNAPAETQGNGPDQYIALLGKKYIQSLPPLIQQLYNAYLSSTDIKDTLREMHTPQRNVVEFARSIQRELASGKTCAIADVAYVNGGDKELGDTLCALTDISQLAAYGGWNTAGNTLGSVVAQAVIRHLQKIHGATPQMLAAHARFLFMRFVEDYLYQGYLRSKFMLETMPLLGVMPTMGRIAAEQLLQILPMLHEQLSVEAAQLAHKAFIGKTISSANESITIDSFSVDSISLPWERLFDLTLDIRCEYH